MTLIKCPLIKCPSDHVTNSVNCKNQMQKNSLIIKLSNLIVFLSASKFRNFAAFLSLIKHYNVQETGLSVPDLLS